MFYYSWPLGSSMRSPHFCGIIVVTVGQYTLLLTLNFFFFVYCDIYPSYTVLIMCSVSCYFYYICDSSVAVFNLYSALGFSCIVLDL